MNSRNFEQVDCFRKKIKLDALGINVCVLEYVVILLSMFVKGKERCSVARIKSLLVSESIRRLPINSCWNFLRGNNVNKIKIV